MGFTSKLLPNGKKVFPTSSQARIYINMQPGSRHEITEAIFVSSTGLIAPVLAQSTGQQECREDLAEILAVPGHKVPGLPKYSGLKRIYSIMGIKRDVLAVERCLQNKAYAALNYHLMTLDGMPAVKSAQGSKGECRRGHPRDAGMLYPLQKAYEIEEVLLNPSSFNTRLCHLHLQKSLRREMVYYTAEKGDAIAKAASNAQGFLYIQIGGVYTVEERRREGYGSKVLEILAAKIHKKGKKACLFVKKDNMPAIRLYSKLGFSIREEFRISYFH